MAKTLMHGRVAQNYAAMGYYPTDDGTMRGIINLLAPSEQALKFLDPCCGEGRRQRAGQRNAGRATGQGEVPGTTRSHRLDEQLCSPFSSQAADLVEGGAAHELRRGQRRGPLLNQVGGAHEPVLSGA